MTTEEMERAIEFLLGHHARIGADLQRQSEQIGKLTEAVASLTGNVETMREEMREGFSNLIVANEVTRKLAEDMARVTVGLSQRVTSHDQRINDLESKQ
jgi:uncharacterized protein YoxC